MEVWGKFSSHCLKHVKNSHLPIELPKIFYEDHENYFMGVWQFHLTKSNKKVTSRRYQQFPVSENVHLFIEICQISCKIESVFLVKPTKYLWELE